MAPVRLGPPAISIVTPLTCPSQIAIEATSPATDTAAWAAGVSISAAAAAIMIVFIGLVSFTGHPAALRRTMAPLLAWCRTTPAP